jgi:geranylgeranyl pyrophosphate synthase
VEALHRYKTAALIRAAVRVGARLGGASPGDLGRLTRYGERLGLAFQITDDILDAAGRDGAEQSKGSEACAEKASYPSVVGLEAANNRARDLARACVREVEAFGVAADPLRWIAHHVVERKM